MKKIAILMRGHVRSYKKTYPILKKIILDNFDCDIFIHSWDCDKEILKLYNPVAFKIEKKPNYNLVHTNKKIFNRLKISYRNQIYSNIVLTNLMKKYKTDNNINYDMVIYTRFDMFFMKILINI